MLATPCSFEYYSEGMQPYLQIGRVYGCAWDVCVCMMLCVCVKMHRLLYVCGVEQYVGTKNGKAWQCERHVDGQFLSWSVERTQLFPTPNLKLGDCCLPVCNALCLLERQNMQGMVSGFVLNYSHCAGDSWIDLLNTSLCIAFVISYTGHCIHATKNY